MHKLTVEIQYRKMKNMAYSLITQCGSPQPLPFGEERSKQSYITHPSLRGSFLKIPL